MSAPYKRSYEGSPDHADQGLPYGADDDAPPRASARGPPPAKKDWRSAFLGDEQPSARDVDPRDSRDRYPPPVGERAAPRDAYPSSAARGYRPRTRSRSRERHRPREDERDVRPRMSREPEVEDGEVRDIPPARRPRTRSPSQPLAPRAGVPPAATGYHRSPPRAAHPGDRYSDRPSERNGYPPRGVDGPYGGGGGGGSWNGGRGGAAPSFRGGRSSGYEPYRAGPVSRAPYDDRRGEPLYRSDGRAASPPRGDGRAPPPEASRRAEPPQKAVVEVIEAIPDEVDEEQALAERRRKRAEILEKFSGQTSATPSGAAATPPPPVSAAAFALGLGREATSSPAPAPSGAVSVNVPPTPALATTPLGAFDLEKHVASASGAASAPDDGGRDAPLPASTAAEQANEISAADYDPSADGRAEEVRRMQVASEQAAPGERAADIVGRETKAEMAQAGVIVKTEGVAAAGSAEETDDDDDDSDDDMFAVDDKPKKPKKAKVDVPMITRALPAVPQSAATLSDNYDTADGYYRIVLGEVLDDGRYHVFSNLGKGMFSAVVKARVVKPDPRTGEVVGQEVAIKIIRSQDSMYKAGLKEIQILNNLRENDPDDKKHIVKLERTFEHRGHLCMVFESLSMNLRDVIKRFGKDLGLNLKAVRAYSHQMFLALSLMKKCSIMHADIKPDNILVTENKSVLKICDLGSASHESESEITPYLVSRFYRAPEIILGLPYDCSLDVWSIGCTLYELYTGKILFPGRTNNQMLLHMMELRGKVNHRMIKKAQFGNIHFDDGLNFLSCEIDKSTGQGFIKVLPMSKPVRDLRARLLPSAVAQSRMRDDELKFLLAFVDLLDKCLQLDPAKRITPKEALQHPFLRAGAA